MKRNISLIALLFAANAACSGDAGGPDAAGAGGASDAATSSSRSSATVTHAASTTSSGAAGADASSSSSAGGAGGGGGAGGSAPATCNGYEPCAVNPVAAPAGYTIQAGITVSNSATNTTCTAFADCDMWDTHFTPVWQPCSGCGTIDNGYNRMGSPFPWEGSRYIFVAPPNRVTYATLHMIAPNETYAYTDGTKEMHTDPDTGVTTCYARGPASLTTGYLGNLGGTGNTGHVDFTISALPGDMGNTGNVSTCQGNGGTTSLFITSDPVKAASTTNASGGYVYCLLREGHDYFVNFMSSGHVFSVDCSTGDCTLGGFAFTNPTTADGSPFRVDVPCN